MELPRLQLLQRDFSKRKVAFLALATVDTSGFPGSSVPATVRECVAKLEGMVEFNKMTLPVGMAHRDNPFKQRYRESAGRTIILDRAGKVLFAGGFQPLEVREAIEAALR